MSKSKKEEVNGGRLFLIIGKSLSGKDTLLNKILGNKSFCKDNKIKKLIRYTTRKPREDEVEGESYYFIDDDTYERKYKKNKNAIVTSFDSKYGKLHYITDLSSLDMNYNYITTTDPETVEACKRIMDKDKLCIIYLIPPTYTLIERFTNRKENELYDSKKYSEFYRRLIDDLLKFSKSDSYINNTTCIINLGKTLKLKAIEDRMIKFLEGENISVIINKTKEFEFHNKHHSATLFSFKDIMENHIKLCDGKIIINTEEETYETTFKKS